MVKTRESGPGGGKYVNGEGRGGGGGGGCIGDQEWGGTLIRGGGNYID